MRVDFVFGGRGGGWREQMSLSFELNSSARGGSSGLRPQHCIN
jgi:hypothetical protein